MAAKCYFTGRKARRVCPGVFPDKSVPISAEACATRMIYEIACPAECPHLTGNYDWHMEKIARRVKGRISSEPWLQNFMSNSDALNLYLEIERCLSIFISRGDLKNDEEVKQILRELSQSSRARKSGLVFNDSESDFSQTAALYNRLAHMLDFYRFIGVQGDKATESYQTFFHVLIEGARLYSQKGQNEKPIQAAGLNPVALKELQGEVPTNDELEKIIQEMIELIKRSLEFHASREGYVNFIKGFY